MLATQTQPASDRRGRAGTGPSASRGTGAVLGAGLITIVALAAAFAFGTQARSTVSPEAFGLVSGLATAIGVAVVVGSPRRVKEFEPGRSLVAFALGAAAFVGAPYVVMLNRYTDAPPGSELLFLTTAAWGALLALALAASRRGAATRVTLVAGALLGLAGAAGIVANWERPSSFSPFFRYQIEESWMVAAGVAVALAWWWLDRERARGALDAAALSAAGGALAAAIALGLARASMLGLAEAFASSGLVLYAAATAVAAAAMVVLLRAVGAGGVAGALFLPAAVLTLLTYIMQVTRVFGPQPILLGPAAGGITATLAAAVLIAVAARGVTATEQASGHTGRLPRVALAVAGMSTLAAAASLALPAMSARVVGLRQDGATLDLRFTLVGVETVGSWLVLALALGSLALAIGALRGMPPRGLASRGRMIAAIAALAAGAAGWSFVRATPLRTLTSFVPTEVQVDFGSEYATIAFAAIPVPLAVAALCGTALALGILLVCVMRTGGDAAPDTRELEGERS